MARLSTHVLDTASGRPAAGVRIQLYTCEPRQLIKTVTTNADGRTDEPLLAGDALARGVYELIFSVADYFGLRDGSFPFLGEIVVRFGVADPAANYHVPLLVSPNGYTTYKGS